MKKLIYISGIVLVNLFVIGTICKLLHFPGANIFILTGLVLFTVAMLPMALINNYRSNGKEKGSLYIAAYLTAALVLVSAMFKIFHWPGAGHLMIIATPLPFALFLPVFLYHNRKHEPKQSLNFIGVMLLLVYVAVFSSLLALKVSKNVIDGISITANDFSSATKIYEQSSSEKYKTLKSSENPDLAGLQQKSETICIQIEEVKADLVRSIDGDDSPALDAAGNVDVSKVINKTESSAVNAIMHGKYENYGEATVLKKSVAEYCTYLVTLTKNDALKQLVSTLLNTSEAPSEVNPGETDTWEMRYFPRNAYLITVLCNLSSVQNSIRIAESAVLEQY